MKPFPFGKALRAGLIVGTLDILAAFIQYYISTKKNPLVVLKFIASGVFGKEAFEAGNIMIVWGLLFHLFIATCFSIFFFWLVAQVPIILRQKLITGILYGIFVWCVMQFLVLPLANTPKGPLNPQKALIAIVILIVCIGIPLAYMAKPGVVRKKDIGIIT